MKSSKDDVFNISVTELLLIIMFSLLVAMVLLSSSLQKEVAAKKETLEEFTKLTQQLIDVNNTLGLQRPVIKPASIELSAAIAQMQALVKALKHSVESEAAAQVLAKMKLDDVWTSLTKANNSDIEVAELLAALNEVNKELEASVLEKDKLDAQLKELANKSTEQAAEMDDWQNKLSNAQNELSESKNELSVSQNKLSESQNAFDQAKSENENLIGQVENLSNGLEFPPCWATPQGKAQYTYLVTVLDDSLILNSIYPDERRDEYLKLMTTDFNEQPLSLHEFKKTLNIFYTTAVASVPECRFFVQVKDATSSDSKKEYKQGLKTVEYIFYKYLLQ
jgi:DNA repair exonuclease SbcCD ATPase subunit